MYQFNINEAKRLDTKYSAPDQKGARNIRVFFDTTIDKQSGRPGICIFIKKDFEWIKDKIDLAQSIIEQRPILTMVGAMHFMQCSQKAQSAIAITTT